MHNTAAVKSQRRMLVLCFLLLLACISGGIAVPAAATDSWPVPLQNMKSAGLTAGYDGSLIAQTCSSPDGTHPNIAQVYDSSGDISSSFDGSGFEQIPCLGAPNATVGLDGAIYGTTWSGYVTQIAARLDGLEKWAPIGINFSQCSGSSATAEMIGMTIGSDGDLYVMAYGGSCQMRYDLIGIDVSTGTVKYRVPLGTTSGPTHQYYTYGSYVNAHSNGLVVRHGSNSFRYFSYAGVEDTARAYSVSKTSAEAITLWNTNTSGDIFVEVVDGNNPSCYYNETVARVVRHTYAGTSSTYSGIAACLRTMKLLPTPDGGALLLTHTYYFGTDVVLTRLAPGGGVSVLDPALPTGLEYVSSQYSAHALVGINGNILLARNLRNPSQQYDATLELVLMNSSGRVLAKSSTADLVANNMATEYAVLNNLTVSLAIGNSYVYGVVCTTHLSGSCPAPQIHLFPFAEVSIDYPRGALLGIQAPAVDELNYVALGDSFSSGEGVEPFYEATDVSPEATEDEELQNMCHRSKKAYAELLDSDPSVGLNLTEFAACSGAETKHVLTIEQWNEGKQLDALKADTDLVTITIGGNDMDFEQFARDCASVGTGSVNCSGQPYTQTLAKISNVVAPNIEDTLDVIDSKLSNVGSDAQVLVIGYPQILPETWTSQSSTDCIWLFEDEHYAIRDVIDTLNDTIEDKVEDKGGRFTFVPVNGTNSPFNGHGLCQQSNQSYFNGPILGQNMVYSFHPNAYGQEAYKTIILNELG